jgi:hypothetical protein
MMRSALIAVAAVFLVTYNSSSSCAGAGNTAWVDSLISSAQTPMTKGTTDLSLNVAPTAGIGKLAIADVLSYNGSEPTITAPEGWQLIRDDYSLTTRQSLYWHTVEANDPTTASWAFSEPVDAQGAILLLDSATSNDPVGMTSGNTGGVLTLTAKSVATAGAGDLILAFYATDFWGVGLGPTLPDGLDSVVNQEASHEYWILASSQSQNGSTEDAVCPTPQWFNWVAAQVAIKQGAL